MNTKSLAILLCLIVATQSYCRPNGADTVAGNPLNYDPTGQGENIKKLILDNISYQQQQQAGQQRQQEYDVQVHSLNTLRQRLDELKNNNGEGMFRTVHGVTNCIYDASSGWHEINGRVTQTLPEGILVRTADGQSCYVQGYPNQTFDGQTLSDCMAKDDGVYAYTTVLDASRTVKKYNYGTPVSPSPEMMEKSVGTLSAEIDANPLMIKAKAEQAAKQKALDNRARVVRLNQEDADRGDTDALLRMGQRYRDGDGVTKDLDKAREYFEKAADAGSALANDEIKKMKKRQTIEVIP